MNNEHFCQIMMNNEWMNNSEKNVFFCFRFFVNFLYYISIIFCTRIRKNSQNLIKIPIDPIINFPRQSLAFSCLLLHISTYCSDIFSSLIEFAFWSVHKGWRCSVLKRKKEIIFMRKMLPIVHLWMKTYMIHNFCIFIELTFTRLQSVNLVTISKKRMLTHLVLKSNQFAI